MINDATNSIDRTLLITNSENINLNTETNFANYTDNYLV